MAIALKELAQNIRGSHYDGPDMRELPQKLRQRVRNAVEIMTSYPKGIVSVDVHSADNWNYGQRSRVYDYGQNGLEAAFFKRGEVMFRVFLNGPLDRKERNEVSKKLGFNPRRARAMVFEKTTLLGNYTSYQRVYTPDGPKNLTGGGKK